MVTVFPRLDAHPAKGLPVFLTEQVQGLSVLHAEASLGTLLGILGGMFKVFYNVGYMPVGPEVSEQELLPTLRA